LLLNEMHLNFLVTLYTKYDYIQNLVGHQVIATYRCNSCDDTKVTTENNFFNFY